MKGFEKYGCDPEDLDLLCAFTKYIDNCMRGYVREFNNQYLQRGLVQAVPKEEIDSRVSLINYTNDIEMRVFLMEKIGKLNRTEKRVFVCCWECGMDTGQIAEYLGTSRTFIRRTKRSIAKKFEIGGRR